MGDSSEGQDVTCQVCGKSWPADHSICPDDGTWLYEQTIIELAPKKRPSLEFSVQSPETTQKGMRVESTAKRNEPLKYGTHATPIRGASSEVIAAQLAPAQGPAEIGPGTQIGEYEVLLKIGEGAMGTVYRAVHPELGKNVAIKVMTPKVFGEAEAVKRFVGEARAVAAIEHPGIVDVFGFGRIPDGRTYLVMEWLDGKSLKARMDEGELPFVDACEIIRQIARALEAAHAKGIIHRDLKPENVFLKTVDDDKPMIKLLDFGLAKLSTKDADLGNVAKTRSGQMLGTPLYMSPEQCKSKGVDHRTDIYALGCMCYELLVGRTPYDADNIAEIITAHLVGEPPRPSKFRPDIDPDLDKLLYGMIQKDPDKRPPLGEIRRILGMQLSKAQGLNPFAHVPSSPFVTPLPSSSVPPRTGQLAPIRLPVEPPVADPGVASTIRQAKPFSADTSLSDEDMLKAIKQRTGPPWYFYVAVLVLVGVVATILILK